jgi:hypothetical protein
MAGPTMTQNEAMEALGIGYVRFTFLWQADLIDLARSDGPEPLVDAASVERYRTWLSTTPRWRRVCRSHTWPIRMA